MDKVREAADLALAHANANHDRVVREAFRRVYETLTEARFPELDRALVRRMVGYEVGR